ncbi:MAG: hypothetical protein V7681_02225 [Halopseudomonas sabulinigri]
MQQFNKWPLALAVSSTILLGGCLSGGGGGGSDGGGASTDGGTTPTMTTYSLTVGTAAATPVAALLQTPTERIANAVIDFLITPAMAEVISELDPSSFRVFNITEDGSTEELINGEDFTAETDGDGYTLELPFGNRYSSYIEIPISSTLNYQVPASRNNLVANPLTTFVTQQIASRLGQFDELTLEEVDQIIEAVLELSSDPELQIALDEAINSSSSTEELLAVVGAKLSATLDEQFDQKAAPALTTASASAASGDYYETTLNIGAFADKAAGVLIGGNTIENVNLAVSVDSATYSVPAKSDYFFEIVNVLGPLYSGITTRAELSDEADSGSIDVDARGLNVAEDEELGPYEKGSESVQDCESESASCTDREYSSVSRRTAAGPASAPFNTLIGSSFYSRDVRDAENQQVLQVVNGEIGFMIRKSASAPALSGNYGAIEFSAESGDMDRLELNAYTTHLAFSSGQVEYCEKVRRTLDVNLTSISNSLNVYDYDQCLPEAESEDRDDIGESGTSPVNLAANGAVDLDLDLKGWVSPDGLTLVSSLEEPSTREAVLEANGETLFTDEGNRQFLMAVKTASNADLANKRYRLVSVSLLGDVGDSLEMQRLNAGTLEFDAQGKASIAAAWQWQNVDASGFAEASLNDQANFSFNGSNETALKTTGELSLKTTELLVDGEQLEFSADGYVQEGERMIILAFNIYSLDEGESHNEAETHHMLGAMVGVCTNCDE